MSTDRPEMSTDDVPDDRTLRVNEEAISGVRREVASAVLDIDRALIRLREVLDTKLPELRATDDNAEEGP